ncbi:reverse transcriptase family protein [Gordonia aichiensis]|uniref:RNA-directed DNA polymerase n=1 Tax=Gordonia aichiensis NBRC 108223 TaxID=1220583 RepID=L7KH14_9ACTN|nr:reverse transcriptase family protein [Gordonia aichiensis]GAC48175.1 putative RNA-directed DNA polymerase [Gordonia aichiensis NBRC 108223]
MTRPEPPFTAAQARAISAAIADAMADWTWPEALRAVGAQLPAEISADIAQSAFAMAPAEPAHTAEVFRLALLPWTAADSPSGRIVELTGPTPVAGLPHGLPPLADVSEFASWLDFTVPELEWFADRGGWLRTANPRLRHYRVSRREKRSGVRVIEAPKPRMRETQRRLLHRLIARIPAHRAARGFEPGSSPAAFGWPHSDRPTVLRVDLQHCFESIGAGRVRRVVEDVGYPPHIARLIAELCTTSTPADQLTGIDHAHASLLRRRHLPQGAPTSPHLANLALAQLDRRLEGYANANGLRYTRYGDDLAISGDEFDAGRALWTVLRIVDDCGLHLNAAKTRVMHRHQQQRLAGLVVNDRPQVSRREYDAVRALLHNAAITGANAQNRHGHNDFRAHVYGLIAWIGATGEVRRQRLLEMADRVDWNR